MKKYGALKPTALALVSILIFTWYISPAQAISINEEKKLAREFMRYIVRKYELVTDPAIVGYVENVGKKILAAMPPQPFKYRFYVIEEDSYNAFAIPAGHIFINSGLVEAMHNEDQLAGILGHEIAHVVQRHLSKRIERSKKINIATMAGMVAGIFLGATTGSPQAMNALTVGSVTAGQSISLAYSREDEAQSDELGLEYIYDAGYDPSALLSVLKIIRSQQWFGSQQIPTYMVTHPALEDRIVWVDSWSNRYKNKIAVKKQPKTKTATAFEKIKIRLKALHGEPSTVIKEFKNTLKINPKDNDTRYGYGLVLARMGKKKEAITYIQKAQIQNALDPLILTDLGKIYFLDGRYKQARNTLQGALSISLNNPEGLFYLGRSQMELDQLDDAAGTFETLINKYKGYKNAYYSLGQTYGRLNNIPDAHYYLGQYYYKKNEYRTAHFHLLRAKRMVQDKRKIKTIEEIIKVMEPVLKQKPANQ